jgi:predicted signal transduction protein with EAL and GGDEF domain
MPASLLQLIPDLVLLVRRDGSVISHAGGDAVPELRREIVEGAGWSESSAALIKQLVRQSIAQRAPVEARVREREREYIVRLTPQGPDRAACSVRAALAGSGGVSTDPAREHPRSGLDRRSFLRRFRESLSRAILLEQPLAVAVLYIDGLPDIAQVIGGRISEQVLSTAMQRLALLPAADGEHAAGYLGQFGEHLLAIAMHTKDRNAIEAHLTGICTSLREPIHIDGAQFRLTPYVGVEVLGLSATTARLLLEQARAAALEARRAASDSIQFHSDTMKLRALARLDMANELRAAVASGAIRFRYVGRHDLATGRLAAWAGYLRWEHPLRGEIRPSEFLRIAESTGFGVELSRAVLRSLCADFAASSAQWAPDVRISFGALRDHIFHEEFLADLERLLREHAIPAERFELRIAEKTFINRRPEDFRMLQERAVQLVVDEVGRSMSSLGALARAPVWGLQLDRAWVTAVHSDAIARKVCRAGVSVATSLGLTSIAAGVDDDALRVTLLEMGCRYGSGDLYLNNYRT